VASDTSPHVAETPEADEAERPAAPTRRPSRRLLPWILVVLAVATALVSTWRWQQLATIERAREDVAATTSQFVTALTTWDASAGMGATRDELQARGTEVFARDVDELFGTTEDLRGLAELGARSEGEVRDVYIQSLAGDRAAGLAVVVQRVTTDEVDSPEVHLRYASVGLERVDGRWLVDDVELLIDAAPSSGAPAATTEPDPEDES
jgi:hypothetical protein